VAPLRQPLAAAQNTLTQAQAKQEALEDQARRDQVALAGLKASHDGALVNAQAGARRVAELETQQAHAAAALTGLKDQLAAAQAEQATAAEQLASTALEVGPLSSRLCCA